MNRRAALTAAIAVTVVVVVGAGVGAALNRQHPTYTAGEARIVPCSNEEAPYTCGAVALHDGDGNVSGDEVPFVLDGPDSGRLVVWLPGGPNSYATALYVTSVSEVQASFPDSQILVLDPPRDSVSGEWAMEDCLPDETQDRFFGALLEPGQEVAPAAESLAEACDADPAARYDSTTQAQAVRSVLTSVAGDREVLVYAASADVHTAAALRAEGVTAQSVILDSAVAAEGDGIAMVEAQATNFVGLTPDLVASDPSELGRHATTPDTAAFALSLIRMPDASPQERASMFAGVSEDDITNVADQYFRRFGEAEYSTLNAAYYSGLCRMYVWPEDAAVYDTAQQRAEQAAGDLWPVTRFIFNYHRPCLTWPDDGAVQHREPFESALVLSSTADPVARHPLGTSWLASHDSVVTETAGHQSILSALGCTIDEVLSNEPPHACAEGMRRLVIEEPE